MPADPALPAPGACTPAAPTGHTGKCWPPAGSCHPAFLTVRLQKGKEITEIQCPEDNSVSPRSQLDGHTFGQRNVEVRTCPAPKGQRPHHWDSTEGHGVFQEKTGGLEQSLCQTGRAWHSPKRSDPQAPQKGVWGLFQHPSANGLLWQSTGWITSGAGEPGLPSLRIATHLPFPFSAVPPASCSPLRRASTECHAFLLKCCLFPFIPPLPASPF